MPKGDRLKLKADPEDGTTPVANLLLEAVAMAKISGLSKGAVIYLWRSTYGWVGPDGYRLKEAKIPLAKWAIALNSTPSRLSRTLAELESKSIIKRRMADPWGGYFYSINTDISKWNSDCINLTKLAECVGIADFATVTENATITSRGNSYRKRNATVTENATQQLPKTQLPTLYKENIKESINKKGAIIKSPYGNNTSTVFKLLDTERGYRPTTKRKAEAASIIRMLKVGYLPAQIMDCWKGLKAEPFWQNKELYMMSVETQIGAMLKKLTKAQDPDKYVKGKYGHLVNR